LPHERTKSEVWLRRPDCADTVQAGFQGWKEIKVMCLAIPAKVIALMPGDRATVSLDGVTSEVSVVFLDDVGAGDYVIIHAGHALSRIDPDEAEKTLEMLRMMSLQGANAGV